MILPIEQNPAQFALSIRQPWAWLILHAGKNIENRDWYTKFRGRVLIHAGKTMTRADYEACAIFVAGIYDQLKREFQIPRFEDLQRGGIVGAVDIGGCVNGNDAASDSPWFVGEWGFMLSNARSLPFQPCKGMLGFFKPQLKNTPQHS